jgi:hypothetical protein
MLFEGYTEVFAWGADRFGQLGLGNKQGGRCYCIPRFCSFNVAIKQIACGEEHSGFITSKILNISLSLSIHPTFNSFFKHIHPNSSTVRVS